MLSEFKDHIFSNCWLLLHHDSLTFTHEVRQSNPWSNFTAVYTKRQSTVSAFLLAEDSRPKRHVTISAGSSEPSRSRDIYIFADFFLHIFPWTDQSHSPLDRCNTKTVHLNLNWRAACLGIVLEFLLSCVATDLQMGRSSVQRALPNV